MAKLWSGIDASKAHHHCVVIDADRNRLLSQKIPNDKPALLELIAAVLKLGDGDGDEVLWATDLNHGGPTLLVGHGQNILYIPGRTVHHASKIYRGDGKTDAKDAAVIADQARMRRDLQPLRAGDEISTGTGAARLHAWLKKHCARSSAAVAAAAVDPAKAQHTIVPAQHVGEGIVGALAREVLALNEELAELDGLISVKVARHRHNEVLLSMPGFGPVLAAELLGATGGNLTVFQAADRSAGVVGLAPALRGSGKVSGNYHRPRLYDRRLLRVIYLSSLSAPKSCPARGYYDRKRGEGKSHIQAMLSLARRRLNVLWAMRRDGTSYTPATVQGAPVVA